MRRGPETRYPVKVRREGVLAAVLSCCVLASAGCDNQPCTAEDVQQALDSAAPGQTVMVGACRVTGSVTIPPGVSLAGSGRGVSSIVSNGGAPAVTVTAGEAQSTIRDLSIESSEGVGLLVQGGGSASISDVDFVVRGGIALGGRNVASLRLARVAIEGPFDADAAEILPANAGPDDGGAFGIVMIDSGTERTPIEMSNVEIRLTGPWGAILENSHVRWRGGLVADAVGVSVLVRGGRATLTDLVVDGALQGIQPFPAYGLVVAGAADVTTDGLVVRGGEGVGVLQESATARHVGVRIESNAYGGMYVQDSPSFTIEGPSAILANGVAGVALASVVDARIQETDINRTEPILSRFGERGSFETADGLQILAPSGPTVLESVTLDNNRRIALLVDMTGASVGLDSLTFTDVVVDGFDNHLGAVAQTETGLIMGGTWDRDIMRLGSTAMNDMAVTEPLEIGGAIAAAYVPDIDLTSFATLR